MPQDNSYGAENITVLEGLEAVRRRPGMYIGSVSTKGLNHLIYEIVDNSVDEHLAGHCARINVYLEKDGSATIEDNGRGIPVEMHEKGISAEKLISILINNNKRKHYAFFNCCFKSFRYSFMLVASLPPPWAKYLFPPPLP